MTIELEYLLINSDKENEASQGRLNLSNVIKVETKTTIERGLVTGIIILLDTASIAL